MNKLNLFIFLVLASAFALFSQYQMERSVVGAVG